MSVDDLLIVTVYSDNWN